MNNELHQLQLVLLNWIEQSACILLHSFNLMRYNHYTSYVPYVSMVLVGAAENEDRKESSNILDPSHFYPGFTPVLFFV